PFAISPDVRPDCDAWGRHLMEAGYRTRYVGKWHAGVERGPVDYGFDVAERRFDAGAYLARVGVGPSRAEEADIWRFTDAGGRAWALYGRTAGPPDASPTAMQAAATIDVLRDLAEEPSGAESPWCVWTNFSGPHEPYAVPEPYASLFDPAGVQLPASFHDMCADKPAYVRRTRQSWFGGISDEHARRAIAHYRGYCAMIDHYVGRILDFLDESGQRDDTLVVFTTDHADMLGAHGLWFKDAYGYEESHHVPLLMRWPAGIAPGTVVDCYARTMDLGPTFLEAAGAAPLDPCHGVSLLPVLRGEAGAAEAPERRELFLEEHGNFFNFTLRAVADGRFKLVWNAHDFDELYDLEEDPHERRNLAADQAHTATYARLCELLWQWMARVEDPYGSERFGASVVLPRGSAARHQQR
ncbi:MAG TPA: sulfatase-like hydrolase/transferase, partial [Chloroflexota bacterium]|nr:sulfatase-like hydrolase/transferase [Chloroflexota bacterium]